MADNLPFWAFSNADFDLRDISAKHPYLGGAVRTVIMGDQFWTARYETVPLDPRGQPTRTWRSFLNTLGRTYNNFLAVDPMRLAPFAYLDDEDDFEGGYLGSIDQYVGATDEYIGTGEGNWGGPVVIAADQSTSTLTTIGFHAGATIKAGDLISFHDETRWQLFEVSADVTASGSGEATLTVSPHPIADFIGAATARMRGACCEMVLTQSPRMPEGTTPSPITFEATQNKE